MTLVKFFCQICGSRELEEFADFAELPRVTSDCKAFPLGGRLAVCGACGGVQKPADSKWQTEAAAIYAGYEPNYQARGVEQAVIDAAGGTLRRRSEIVLDRLMEIHPLGLTGSILDVGCGNGALLRAFAQTRPYWQLFGYELSDLHEPSLAMIPRFARLYCGPLGELPAGFNLISMMHALEHFPDPAGSLRDLRAKLAEHGLLLIQVPNSQLNPFDLLIADHLCHFTRHHLSQLIARAGLSVKLVTDDWVTKELSAVASPEGPLATLPAEATPAQVLDRVRKQIAWLKAVIGDARKAARGTFFGIFGTSIAAMWLFGQLADEIAFFVDEDPGRRNTTLFGRPVHTPAEIPAGASVYIPLMPTIARTVAARLARPRIVLHVPAEIGD